MTTVIKLGGAVCAKPETITNIVNAWRRRGMPRWIIAHGGGPQLDLALNSLEGEPERVNGLRVTSPEGAQLVQKTLDLVGAQIAQKLREAGANAIHVPASDALFHAVPKTVPDGDLGRVGTVTTFDADRLMPRMKRGCLAVVTPVGWDAQGPLNINADEGAVAVATDCRAQRLILATDVDGVRDETGQTRTSLSPAEARSLIGGAAKGGMIPKLNNAMAALEAGVERVDIGRPEVVWNRKAPCTRMQVTPVVTP